MMVHPNSLANLDKRKQFSTGDERAKICGRKGRESLTENIRQRKAIAEYFEDLLSSPVTEEKIRAELERKGVKKKDRNYAAAVAISLLGKALKGDVNSLKLGLSLVDEMPSEQSDVNMTVTNEPKVILEDYDDGRGGYE